MGRSCVGYTTFLCYHMLSTSADIALIRGTNSCFMSQVWFVGPGAKQIGNPEYGTDLGFEVAAACAGISYPVFRYFEKKHWGY